MFTRAFLAAAIAALAGWSGTAAAADASGHVVSVRQQAKASGPAGNRTIDAQGPVFAGDVITTDRRGSAQLLFADQTKMVIGPNSQVTIDDFVLKGDKASVVSIDALRGSFRFITGISAKNVYKINTPVATIGVRGTEFSGHIGPNGELTLAMWGGATVVCPSGGACQVVAGTCTLVVVPPAGAGGGGGAIERINNVYRRTQLMEQRLPFAFQQGWLQTPFRVESQGCNIQNYDPVTDPNDDDDQGPPETGNKPVYD